MSVPELKEILKILFIIAAPQSCLIIIHLVIKKKGNIYSRLILGLLMFVFMVFLTGSFLLFSKQFNTLRFYAHLANLSIFLAIPLLYLYFKSLTTYNFRLKLSYLYHALVFAVIFIYMFYAIIYKRDRHFVFNPLGIGLISCLIIQNLGYLFVITRSLNNYEPLKNRQKLNWFKIILIGFAVLYALKLLIFIICNVFGHIDVCIYLTGIVFIFSVIVINTIVIMGLHNPALLSDIIKYGSNNDIDAKGNDYQSILRIIEGEKVYLSSLLTLDKLAKQLGINGKKVSEIINQFSGMNFNDFINRYRIEAAKNMILNDINGDESILDIAWKAGFNSKSTFNAAFKKFTQVTPSQFRDQIKKLSVLN